MYAYDEMQRRTIEDGILHDVDLPDDKEKIREIEEKLKLDPTNPKLWAGRAAFHWAAEFADAVRCYSRALYYLPFSGDLHFNRARKYMSLHRYDEALAGFELSLRIDPKPNVKWYYHAVSAVVLKMFDVAVTSFAEDIRQDRQSDGPYYAAPVAWSWYCYTKLGKKDEAKAMLETFDLDSPVANFDEGYRRRVALHRGLMTVDEVLAGVSTTDAISAMSDYFAVGCQYRYMLGDIEKAVGYFEKATAFDTGHHAFAYVVACNELEECRERKNT